MAEISYLGVQQIEADPVVHDITVVRCVPVAEDACDRQTDKDECFRFVSLF